MDGGGVADLPHSIPAVVSSTSPDTPAVDSRIAAVPSTAEEAEDISSVDSPPPSDGINDGLDQAAPQSLDDLRAKILKQVEYYFSDENLPNDKFLVKHVKKDKEGFVSISLIASFRKMKRLTKDSSLIVDVLKESSRLVVSRDGKKVKRRHPLPSMEINRVKKTDKAYKCSTVIVENLPEDHSNDNIRKIFGQVGSINSISIHDSHADEPAGQTNKAEREKLICGKLYALVTYETAEAAAKAVATLNDETDWRNGLRVNFEQKLMVYGKGPKAWQEPDYEKVGHDRAHVSIRDEYINRSNELCDNTPNNEDGDHASKERNARKGRNRSKGRKYRSNGMGHGTSLVEPSKPPPGPRMPDGTRGFTMGRGRTPISSTLGETVVA